MDYSKQAKMIKPTAKSCDWCKHIGIYKEENTWEEIFVYEECFLNCNSKCKLSHRLNLKMNRENDFRYCQHYRFSKENFKKWKNEYNYLEV